MSLLDNIKKALEVLIGKTAEPQQPVAEQNQTNVTEAKPGSVSSETKDTTTGMDIRMTIAAVATQLLNDFSDSKDATYIHQQLSAVKPESIKAERCNYEDYDLQIVKTLKALPVICANPDLNPVDLKKAITDILNAIEKHSNPGDLQSKKNCCYLDIQLSTLLLIELEAHKIQTTLTIEHNRKELVELRNKHCTKDEFGEDMWDDPSPRSLYNATMISYKTEQDTLKTWNSQIDTIRTKLSLSIREYEKLDPALQIDPTQPINQILAAVNEAKKAIENHMHQQDEIANSILSATYDYKEHLALIEAASDEISKIHDEIEDLQNNMGLGADIPLSQPIEPQPVQEQPVQEQPEADSTLPPML